MSKDDLANYRPTLSLDSLRSFQVFTLEEVLETRVTTTRTAKFFSWAHFLSDFLVMFITLMGKDSRAALPFQWLYMSLVLMSFFLFRHSPTSSLNSRYSSTVLISAGKLLLSFSYTSPAHIINHNNYHYTQTNGRWRSSTYTTVLLVINFLRNFSSWFTCSPSKHTSSTSDPPISFLSIWLCCTTFEVNENIILTSFIFEFSFCRWTLIF